MFLVSRLARGAAAQGRPTVCMRAAATQRGVVLSPGSLKLEIRDVEVDEPLTPNDVRIKIAKVGICGSDVHYYKLGEWPPYIMKQDMILGHEASGIVTEVGEAVTNLKIGDRVCMEPGVPDFMSKETLAGRYNVCRQVRFWATPPAAFATSLVDSSWANGHGTLRQSVVHPAAFTFKLPDQVSLEWGALVEPLAVGMHACTKASIKPGEVAVVVGAGPIGMLTAMVAAASGCARVIVVDVVESKIRTAETLAPGVIEGVLIGPGTESQIMEMTNGGADVVLECAGNVRAAEAAVQYAAPGGRVLLIGCSTGDPTLSLGTIQTRELTVMGIFRYINVFPKAVALLASGKINLDPIITNRFNFEQSVEAFDMMCSPPQNTIKSIITVDEHIPNLPN